MATYITFAMCFIITRGVIEAACPSRKYGYDCSYNCHCESNSDCDETTGKCPGRCATGWEGESCQTGNGALRKPARQSSNYNPQYSLAKEAVDGNTGMRAHRRCTHTNHIQNPNDEAQWPWWLADLGAMYALFSVTVYSRICAGTCGERMQNFMIWLRESDEIPAKSDERNRCKYFPGIAKKGEATTISCDEPVVGRFLIVKRVDMAQYNNQGQILTICELKIRAFKYRDCSPLLRFGINCNYRCHCFEDESCSVINGTCPNGCSIYYSGPACQKQIPILNEGPFASDITATSVVVTWHPWSNATEVFRYILQYRLDTTNSTWINQTYRNDENLLLRLQQLSPHSQYICRGIVILAGGAEGPPGNWTAFRTPCSEPAIAPEVLEQTANETEISLTLKELSKGEINCEAVKTYTVYYKASSSMNDVWIELSSNLSIFHLMNLASGTRYSFVVAVTNDANLQKNSSLFFIETTRKGGNTSLIIGASLSSLIVVCLIIGTILLIVRRRRKNKDPRITENKDDITLDTLQSDDSGIGGTFTWSNAEIVEESRRKGEDVYENYQTTEDHEIFLQNLADVVKGMKNNDWKKFSEEYQTIAKELGLSQDAATLPENKSKNRFKNIVPYDHCRVKLKGTESDYINASYLHGYERENKFIASQGPKATTVEDTWHMIWQEQCSLIVMLTSIVEGGKDKCEQYWPDDSAEPKRYGEILITLKNVQKYSTHTISTLLVKKGAEDRTVMHFHLTNWPDHGTPRFASSFVQFWRQVTSREGVDNKPIMVHCSAGVGRTGTYIACDYLFHQGLKENKIDVYECVERMRKQRPKMVQTLNQYKFVHDALVEFFIFGKTAIPCDVFQQEYDKRKTTVLPHQFHLIEKIETRPSPKMCSDALSDENTAKNRNINIIPENSARPKLIRSEAGRSDYINAVFVNGYLNNYSYIVTQYPLSDTIVDFWRLVRDYPPRTLVTLDKILQEDEVFWPATSEALNYESFSVECLSLQDPCADISTRDLKLFVGSDSTKSIRQFHLHSWPEVEASTTSLKSIVMLASMVQEWQRKSGNNTILVASRDGGEKCGTFCVTYSAIEKAMLDHEMDIFEISRLVRADRHQLVKSLKQYHFLHLIMAEYLRGFETYANFQ